MTPPINIGGDTVEAITIDGTSVGEVTVGGDVVFSTIPDSLIDNFEKILYGDRGNSLSDYYTGDLADFARNTNNPVIEGSYSLKGPTAATTANLISTSGLQNYPAKGDVISCYVRDAGAGRPQIRFGLQDANNFYGAEVLTDLPRIDIKKNGSGISSSANLSLSSNAWYEIEVEWHDGSGSQPDNTIVVTLYDVDSSGNRTGTKDSVSTTDSDNASNTGIGFRKGNNDGSKVIWDDYTNDGTVP